MGDKGRVRGGEGNLKENSFMNSSITEAEIFKAVYDIWRPSLFPEVPPSHEFTKPCYNLFPALSPHMSDAAELWSAEQLSSGRGETQGYRTAGAMVLKGHCWKVLAQLQHRVEAQTDHKVQRSRETFLPCDFMQHTASHVSTYGKFRRLLSHQARRAALRAWKRWSLALVVRKSHGFVLTLQYTHDHTSKGYLTEPLVLHSHSLLYPIPQDFPASSLAVF